MRPLSLQAKGLLITLAGVLALCPDTLLVRLLDMEKWSLLFYRGIMLFFCLSLFTAIRHGRKTGGCFTAIGLPGIWLALLFTVSTISFVMAIYFTTVANTLIILSSASMFAALLGKMFLKETIPLRTGVAASIILATLSGLLTAIIAGVPASLTVLDGRSLCLLFLLCALLAVSFGLLTVGPRYITAAEVSLLMPLETVIAPLLIWLVLGEQPATATLVGGPIVILTLLAHPLQSLRPQAQPIR